jgi:predicted transcriptional regulator of viral defense system
MAYIKMQYVLEELAGHNKRVFGLNDISKITGKAPAYLSKILAANPRVKRAERGKYYLTGLNGADMYEIASNIVFPSYVSMFAAFQFYNLTEQSIVKYSVVTTKRHRRLRIENNTIEFISIAKDRFFGYKKVGSAYIALVEKAIVDSIYMHSPDMAYVEDAFSKALHRGMMDKKLLAKFALRMKSKALSKEVAKLLKANGIGDRRALKVKP